MKTIMILVLLLGFFLMSPSAHAVMATPQIAFGTNAAAITQLRVEQQQQLILRQNAYLRGVSDERGRELAHIEDLIYFSMIVVGGTGLYLLIRLNLPKHISTLGKKLSFVEKPGSDSPPKPSDMFPKAM